MNRRYKILLLVSILSASVVSLFASSSPDGLEKVAEDKGFIVKALNYPSKVLMPDYELNIFGNDYLAVAFAGMIGTIIVFAFVYFALRPIAIKK
ncbi:MAG: PDGLE domain-containing protein [Patescibacteria group bacterium]|jgi:cobalt/nickel transport protein